MNNLQSYTLDQLRKLQLLTLKDDWLDAFSYIGFDYNQSVVFTMYITEHGILKFITEYMLLPKDMEHFDFAIKYLINKFNL